MLERLRKAKEEQEQPEEGSLDGIEEPEPVPEPEKPEKPRSSRRRASLGIPKKFGIVTRPFPFPSCIYIVNICSRVVVLSAFPWLTPFTPTGSVYCWLVVV